MGEVSEASKKRRRTFLTADSEIDNEFLELDLRKYCPKKVFDIILINEVDENAEAQMVNLINTFRKYEDEYNMTFIKHSEVLATLDNFDLKIIPQDIRGIVDAVLDDARTFLSRKKFDTFPLVKLAVLMKLKLLEVMVRHFEREVLKIEGRKVLIEKLDDLTRDYPKNVETQSKNQRSNLNTRRSAQWMSLPDNDVVFDDDIYNHVWFYAFVGIHNSKVIPLLVNGKVPITAVLKVNLDNTGYLEPDSPYSMFWSEMEEMLFSHMRSVILENTILMKFTIKTKQEDEQTEIFDKEETFLGLVYTIKYISEIKLLHLNYIRHLQIYEMDSYQQIPINCMHTYHKLTNKMPLEMTSSNVVLSCIIEEVVTQLDGYNNIDKYLIKDDSKKSKSASHSKCPGVSHNIHRKPNVKEDVGRNDHLVFQCYHKDWFGKTLNMCKPWGKIIFDLSMNVLKCIHPFSRFEDFVKCDNYQREDHDHDIASVAANPTVQNREILDHLINLLVFCSFEDTISGILPNEPEIFSPYLVTYDSLAAYKNLSPQVMERASTHSRPFESAFHSYNVNPMDFYWKEDYPSFVLFSELIKAHQRYSYVDTTYCPDTDRLLVQFSDWLDDFGLHTKVYAETLLTPVCLRDFCRYTANEVASWLKENPPPKYVRKSEEAEGCKGALKLKKVEMYEEYHHLLETKPVSELNFDNITPSYKTTYDYEVTFDEMMLELENYPPNTKLKDEYTKKQYIKHFLAYDFGTKYFGLRGAKNIFSSHDGVKLYVENCKFIDENDRCVINLYYKDNNMVVHSSDVFRNFYSYHWLLEDQTIVVFEIQRKSKKSTKLDNENTEIDEKSRVHSRDRSKMADISTIKVKTKGITTNIVESDIQKSAVNLYSGMLQAIENDRPLYKMAKKIKTLKKAVQPNEVHIASILERVLHAKDEDHVIKEADLSKSRKFVPLRGQYNLPVIESVVFRVTLPNGIYVSCYPSVVKETLMEVKQEILSANIESLKHEEFRMYTREGCVIIKKIDGSITMLMSNGSQVDLEKPNSMNENIRTSNVKDFHYKTINDYRKRLNKLMKNSGLIKDNYYISRRGSLQTKRGYILNPDFIKLMETNKLPYSKTTLINFDGTRTVLEGNKISQKHLFYSILENDLCEEEMYYERKDGLKCILQKNGSKIVEFPDRTRITAQASVANELVDGYVYVTLYYKFEHPNYATVSYSEGDMLQVLLNSVVIIKPKDGSCTLKLDDEAKCVTDVEHINFTKTCPKCKLSYKCSFDIGSFHNNCVESSKQFVHAEDSYKKHFFVDYSGVCRVNKNYLAGNFNTGNCNHVGKNKYKQLFLIRKSMCGEELFTEEAVNAYKEEIKKKDNVKIMQKGKNHPVLRFQFDFYRSFTEQYHTQSVLSNSLCLTKYKENQKKNLYYSAWILIKQMINSKEVHKLLSYLAGIVDNIDVSEKTRNLIKWLDNKKEEEAMLKAAESREREEAKRREEAMYCKCVKDKKTFARKIKQWKDEYSRLKALVAKGEIPLYFNSDFCQVVKKRR